MLGETGTSAELVVKHQKPNRLACTARCAWCVLVCMACAGCVPGVHDVCIMGVPGVHDVCIMGVLGVHDVMRQLLLGVFVYVCVRACVCVYVCVCVRAMQLCMQIGLL